MHGRRWARCASRKAGSASGGTARRHRMAGSSLRRCPRCRAAWYATAVQCTYRAAGAGQLTAAGVLGAGGQRPDWRLRRCTSARICVVTGPIGHSWRPHGPMHGRCISVVAVPWQRLRQSYGDPLLSDRTWRPLQIPAIAPTLRPAPHSPRAALTHAASQPRGCGRLQLQAPSCGTPAAPPALPPPPPLPPAAAQPCSCSASRCTPGGTTTIRTALRPRMRSAWRC